MTGDGLPVQRRNIQEGETERCYAERNRKKGVIKDQKGGRERRRRRNEMGKERD